MKMQHIIIASIVLIVGMLLFSDSSNKRRPEVERARQAKRAAESLRRDSDALINAITRTLNHLPEEVSVNLTPPVNILDDSKSINGQEVLATCGVTPGVTDSPFNYLQVTTGNAGFEKLGVKSGDLIRYFVVYTQEDEEHGVQELTYIKPELVVRRLDINNPNSLIFEGGLNAPMPVPSRIEIWRFSDKRMNEINSRMNRYLIRPKQLQGWEPSPDESALVLLHDRLNQWLRNLPKNDSTWKAESLVETLPQRVRQSEELKQAISIEGQRDDLFTFYDTRLLQQAIWIRDISDWAKANAVKDIEVALSLFDWTIRNIQLEPTENSNIVHQPWQALMYGTGTAEHRSWIFAELCRQQQLDVVMLSISDEGKSSKPWLSALLSQGRLYLFDSRLGLAIPGEAPDTIATLEQLAKNPELLRNLDLDEENRYPITDEDLRRIEAQIIASPLQISKRASELQKEMKADNFAVLAAKNRSLIDELKSNPNIQNVKLWSEPFQAVLDELEMSQKQRAQAVSQFLLFAQRPRLWKARVLHFQGTKDIPSNQRNDPLAQADYGHEKATALYVNPRIRPSKEDLARIEPTKRIFYNQVKKHASYWQGLLRYDLGDYNIALHWLNAMTLKPDPKGKWSPGARYNLARTYEAIGKTQQAIRLLEIDTSAQSYGNKLRARQLKQKLEAKENQ